MLALCKTTFAAAGAYAWNQWRELRYLVAVVGCVLFASLKPRHWPRTVRSVFTRQLLFTGVEASRFVVFVAILAGITVVVETYLWLDKVGLSEKIGPPLVMLVARELGPLSVNIMVIVRSGSATASELGVMRVSGEVRGLEAQGIEPFLLTVLLFIIGGVVVSERSQHWFSRTFAFGLLLPRKGNLGLARVQAMLRIQQAEASLRTAHLELQRRMEETVKLQQELLTTRDRAEKLLLNILPGSGAVHSGSHGDERAALDRLGTVARFKGQGCHVACVPQRMIPAVHDAQ